jgi:hypothetical protein
VQLLHFPSSANPSFSVQALLHPQKLVPQICILFFRSEEIPEGIGILNREFSFQSSGFKQQEKRREEDGGIAEQKMRKRMVNEKMVELNWDRRYERDQLISLASSFFLVSPSCFR